MNISRQTFGNIIESARKKISDCLVNAKALKIDGGTVRMAGMARGQSRERQRGRP